MEAFSKETLDLFEELLVQSSLSLGHPDFEQQANRVSVARREIQAARSRIDETG